MTLHALMMRYLRTIDHEPVGVLEQILQGWLKPSGTHLVKGGCLIQGRCHSSIGILCDLWRVQQPRRQAVLSGAVCTHSRAVMLQYAPSVKDAHDLDDHHVAFVRIQGHHWRAVLLGIVCASHSSDVIQHVRACSGHLSV